MRCFGVLPCSDDSTSQVKIPRRTYKMPAVVPAGSCSWGGSPPDDPLSQLTLPAFSVEHNGRVSDTSRIVLSPHKLSLSEARLA